MANEANITTAYGDNLLQLSANRLVRKFDNPGGATDIRVGWPARFTGTDQTFSSTTSIYETCRIAFTTGTDVVPGFTGEFIGIGNAVGSNASCTYGGNDGLSNVYSVGNVSRLYNLTTNAPISSSLVTDATNLAMYGSNYMKTWVFRLVKSSTDTILFESYNSTSGLPYSDSSMNNAITSPQGLTRRHSYIFASTGARDAVFDSINTIFFSCPWYNANIQMAALAYRII